MNIVIGIQARSGSTRLHEKSLQKIGDAAIIDHCVTTCRLTGLPVYVLPPMGDAVMADHCVGQNYLTHVTPAPENDVLARYLSLQQATGADAIMRITGDCPFPFVPMLCWAAAAAEKHNADFVTNVWPPLRLPDGWDTEVVSAKALRWLDKNSSLPEREHVTKALHAGHPALHAHDCNLTVVCLNYPLDLSSIKISIDTQEDLDRVREMYHA